MRHVDLVGGGDVWFVYDASGTRVRKVQENQAASTRTDRIYLGDLEIYREHVGNELRRERQTLHVADDTGRVCMFETLTVDGGEVRPDASPILRYQYGNHLGSTALELARQSFGALPRHHDRLSIAIAVRRPASSCTSR